MKELGDGYELLLIGESEEEDEEIVRQTILMNGLTNGEDPAPDGSGSSEIFYRPESGGNGDLSSERPE